MFSHVRQQSRLARLKRSRAAPPPPQDLRHPGRTHRRSRHRLNLRVIIETSGDNLIRTQISLEEREYALVKREAAALGIPIAELVRRALRQALPVDAQAPWMRYAGFVESGDPNSSQSVDEIVYGSKD
jgi:hypothetical protein